MSYFVIWFFKITAAPLIVAYLKIKAIFIGNRPRLGPNTLIVSNHISMYDPVVICSLYPARTIRVVGSRHLFLMNPILGWFLRKMGVIAAGRDGDDISAVGEAVRLLREGGVVCIFPEGRRSLDGEPLPFRPGAAAVALKSGATVIPTYHYGKKGWFRRARVVVGQPFRLADCLPARNGGADGANANGAKTLDAANRVLAERVLELRHRVPTK